MDAYMPDVFETAEVVADDGMTIEPCPECGAMKRWRNGKFGKFLGCSLFPKCEWTSYKKEAA